MANKNKTGDVQTGAVQTVNPGADTLSFEAVQAQVAEMLAQARAEADKIVADARAAATGKTAEEEAAKAERAKKRAEDNAYMNELVEIKLFKDNDKYKEPVFVGVNGETIAVERGVKVKVKRKFARALERSDKQDYETSKLIESKSGEFAASGL